jgi:hypothetical protein
MKSKSDFFLLERISSLESIPVWIITPEKRGFDERELITTSTESSFLLEEMSNRVSSGYFFLQIKPGEISAKESDFDLWLDEAIACDADLSYCNYFELSGDEKKKHPVIDYSSGSIRDDFNFGPLVLIKTCLLKEYIDTKSHSYDFAGWYDFRLFISRKGEIKHFNQFFYSYNEPDLRLSGAKQFDYVNPMNRSRQVEMELAATDHLKKIGALVVPPFREIESIPDEFDVEASVIIPVLNREKTIADAIDSVLKQQTSFLFNLIIIDNHSSDKTPEIIESFHDSRIIHLIPERKDLGIGGCWNEGINHPECGRFAIQLDSDDLYKDETTLTKIVNKFYEERCAMVIGSYQMVNFKLEEIPPGIIDHREWSDTNGPNNALRINGLGAPRAFYTPVIRQIEFPNVSYGEDYAVAIAISRSWKVGRIYEPVYLCRRWDHNTDSNLGIDKVNDHNAYKDSLRSEEISIRKSKSFQIK